jgi:CRISPR-associated protein Csb1
VTQKGSSSVYAFERRFLDGDLRAAVIVDSKQSQLNRAESAIYQQVLDGHPLVSRIPRIEVVYERAGVQERYADLTLPHRFADGHIRAATRDGVPAVELAEYLAMRDAKPANALALLQGSPVSLVFGSWDSSRATNQGRWPSALVGEIIGFCQHESVASRGGARVDPVGMRVNLSREGLEAAVGRQSRELSKRNVDKQLGEAGRLKKGDTVSASGLGLGGIPPTLNQLAGVACDRIVRTHVLSFAKLRQIRFGKGPQGDAACRALLAAFALNALARSDSELDLRAGCDLVEAEKPAVTLDQRWGAELPLEPLTVEAADALLEAALGCAESAGVDWSGQVLELMGDPAIVAGSVEDEAGAEES